MITIDELKAKLGGMKTAVDDLRDALSIEASEKRLAELEHQMTMPGFYDDQARSQKVISEMGEVKNKLERFGKLSTQYEDFSCTMLPVKAVREAVITTLIEWHDKFVSVIYVNDESSVTTFHIIPSYIPKGFSQVEVPDESSGFYYGQFSDSHNNWFDILVLPIENTQETFLDNEFSTYYSINFNGIQAIWGIMNDGSNTLLWERGTLSFQVCGNLDLTELIKISEKIGVE